MARPVPPSPDPLLSQTRWMRALALGLVSDPNEADDVVQEAALAALMHGPRDGAPSRAWLRTVVRNFAWRRRRTETRRTDREVLAAGATDRVDCDGLDAVERIDTHRMLLDAVRALDEPLRSTVVQRYLEGRTSADIARATGVPQGTVRARLKRGLEHLRERLDDEHGSREAWITVVAPMALPLAPTPSSPPVQAPDATSTVAALAQGTAVMGLLKIGLTGTFVLLAALGGWRLTQSSPRIEQVPHELVVAADPAPRTVQDADVVATVSGEGRREAVASNSSSEPAPESPVELANSETFTAFLDVRFVDEYDTPLSGVQAALMSSDGSRQKPWKVAHGQSDRGGGARVEVELPSWADADETGLAAARFELVATLEGRTSHRQRVLFREGETTQLGDVVLLRGARIQGRVVDQHGAALEGALVGAVDASHFDGLTPIQLERIGRLGDDAFDRLTAATTRVDGEFELGGLAAGTVRVWAHAPDRRFGLSETIRLDPLTGGVEIEVVVPDFGPTDRIAGRVVGPDGRGRRASITRYMTTKETSRGDTIRTDADGLFSFPVASHDSVYQLTAGDMNDEFSKVQVRDVRPGDMDVEIAFRAPVPFLVRLRDADDQPVEGGQIWIGIDGFYSRVRNTQPAPGDYVIDRPSGTFRLEAKAPGFRENDEFELDDATAPDAVDLVMERALVVEGEVLANGAPVEGAIVEAFQYDTLARETVNGMRCSISRFECGTTRSDAEGRFRLEVDLRGPFVVRARHADHVDAETAPMTPDQAGDPISLSFASGGSIEGTVHVPPGESAGGLVVGVHRGDGRPRSVRTAPDGSYRFDGLIPGDWNVFLTDDDIDPRGGSFSSVVTDEPLTWDCRVELGRTTRFDIDQDDD